MKNFSVGELNRDFGAFFGQVFGAFFGQVFGGALQGNLLPWQRGMIGQSTLTPLPGRGIFEDVSARMIQMRRDIDAFFAQAATRRPTRPWAYWQFKNGKLAPLSGPRDLPFDMEIDWYLAYDRTLGCDVVYAAR